MAFCPPSCCSWLFCPGISLAGLVGVFLLFLTKLGVERDETRPKQQQDMDGCSSSSRVVEDDRDMI